MSNKSPNHTRRQGYTPTRDACSYGKPNGRSNGKTNYAGKTPKTRPMKDPNATYTY